MDMLQIVLLSLIASVLYIILKSIQPTFAFVLILFVSIIILYHVIGQIQNVIQLIQTLGNQANVSGLYLETILKIIGIAYIAEIGSSLTQDAGLHSVAKNIELAGKVFILLLAIPIITAVVDTIIRFLPTI